MPVQRLNRTIEMHFSAVNRTRHGIPQSRPLTPSAESLISKGDFAALTLAHHLMEEGNVSPPRPMRHQALIDACRNCSELCARCEMLMDGLTSFNDCPHCCRACRSICEMLEALVQVEGILFIQALRLGVSISGWCAEQCSQHPDADFQECAGSCIALRDRCQEELEMAVSAMVQQD